MEKVLALRKSLSLSLVFHTILFIALIVTIVMAPPAKPPTTLDLRQSDKIVQAVSVNQAQVEQEMASLKNQQAQKVAAEKARLAALKLQAQQAAQAKLQQQKALAALKAEQQAAVKQQQAQLAKLQQQQAAAQKQLQLTKQNTQKAAQQQTLLKQQKINEQKQLQQSAEKTLQQQLAQDATQLDQAKQQQVNSELAKYTELIRQAIGQQWIIPANSNRSAYSILDITLGPGGVVNNVQLKQSSGDPVLDRSAITAVYKASPLPVPTDPALFKLMQDIQLKVQPDSIM